MRRSWRRQVIVGVVFWLIMLLGLGTAGDWTTHHAMAQPLAADSGKTPLIGTLQGPEVITDPARFPPGFKEAPQLAELVKAGKLPPVAERIGQDPIVVQPLHAIST